VKPRLTNELENLERQAAQRESASRTELEENYIEGYDEGFADGYLVGVQDTVRKFEGREL
jgi:flagellar biosynthesis/type III secretory pathway protein FliH